nr:cation:dicarboxylase symporter family transporter [Streptococcus equi]
MKRIRDLWVRTNLIKKIGIGVVIGLLLGILLPDVTAIGILGQLFVGALKAIAPLLVFCLGGTSYLSPKVRTANQYDLDYCALFAWNLPSGLGAVIANYLFPLTLTLNTPVNTELSPPQGIVQVFQTLLLKLVDNPINALATANYIGVLAWALIFGLALKSVPSDIKHLIKNSCRRVSNCCLDYQFSSDWYYGLGLFNCF